MRVNDDRSTLSHTKTQQGNSDQQVANELLYLDTLMNCAKTSSSLKFVLCIVGEPGPLP